MQVFNIKFKFNIFGCNMTLKYKYFTKNSFWLVTTSHPQEICKKTIYPTIFFSIKRCNANAAHSIFNSYNILYILKAGTE